MKARGKGKGEEKLKMEDRARWTLLREVWTVLGECIDRAVDSIIADSGLDRRGWGLLLAALTFEPENTTPAHLMVRSPYTAAEEFLIRMSTAAGLGFMEEVAPGEYALSPAGRTSVQHFLHTAREALADIDPLPSSEAETLSALLDRLIQRCLRTPPPPKTWSIRLSYQLMPPIHPPLPYIEQAFSCLSAYRDDAHLAAWQGSDLAATSLEVLTLLWRKEASSFREITERLVHRGHPSHVYQDALEELRSRGLIEEADNSFHLTSTGQQFRDQVEAETDRYFFAPWSCLNEAEKERLSSLLARLRDGMKVISNS